MPVHDEAVFRELTTSVGSRLLALAHNRWCAFEIDDVSGLFEVGANRARPRHTRDAA